MTKNNYNLNRDRKRSVDHEQRQIERRQLEIQREIQLPRVEIDYSVFQKTWAERVYLKQLKAAWKANSKFEEELKNV